MSFHQGGRPDFAGPNRGNMVQRMPPGCNSVRGSFGGENRGYQGDFNTGSFRGRSDYNSMQGRHGFRETPNVPVKNTSHSFPKEHQQDFTRNFGFNNRASNSFPGDGVCIQDSFRGGSSGGPSFRDTSGQGNTNNSFRDREPQFAAGFNQKEINPSFRGESKNVGGGMFMGGEINHSSEGRPQNYNEKDMTRSNTSFGEEPRNIGVHYSGVQNKFRDETNVNFEGSGPENFVGGPKKLERESGNFEKGSGCGNFERESRPSYFEERPRRPDEPKPKGPVGDRFGGRSGPMNFGGGRRQSSSNFGPGPMNFGGGSGPSDFGPGPNMNFRGGPGPMDFVGGHRSMNSGRGHRSMNSGGGHRSMNSGGGHRPMNSGGGHRSMNSGREHRSMNSGREHRSMNSGREHRSMNSGREHRSMNSGREHRSMNSGREHRSMNSGRGHRSAPFQPEREPRNFEGRPERSDFVRSKERKFRDTERPLESRLGPRSMAERLGPRGRIRGPGRISKSVRGLTTTSKRLKDNDMANVITKFWNGRMVNMNMKTGLIVYEPEIDMSLKLDGSEVQIEFPNTFLNYKSILEKIIDIAPDIAQPRDFWVEYYSSKVCRERSSVVENFKLDNGELLEINHLPCKASDPCRKVALLAVPDVKHVVDEEKLKEITGADQIKIITRRKPGSKRVFFLTFATAEEATAAQTGHLMYDHDIDVTLTNFIMYRTAPGYRPPSMAATTDTRRGKK